MNRSAWERLRGAASATIFVHALTTALAFLVARPLVSQIAAELSAHPDGAHALFSDGGTYLLHYLTRRGGELAMSARLWTLCALLLCVVAPWARLAWLRQIARGGRLSSALGEAARKYPAALRLWLAWIPMGMTAAALLIGVPYVVGTLISTADVRHRDLARFIALAPGLIALAWFSCWLDLASAEIARGTSSAFAALIRTVKAVPRTLVFFLGATLLGATLFVLGHLVGNWAAPFGWAAVFCAQQSVAFARTLVRGGWLALATSKLSEF